MFEIVIKSNSGNYRIAIGSSSNFIDLDGYAIVDNNLANHLSTSSKNCIFVEASESIKTLTSCESLILKLNDLGLKRGDLLNAVGGGTIQDIATLTASLYMRGVPWIYYPTTLMSMTDSCMGGKSAINAGVRKNLVGNFYPPSEVIIDTKFLETNSKIDIVNGLSEAVKINFARNENSFTRFLELPSSLFPQNNLETAELIYLTLSSKQWFVEIDEFDLKERQLLNFGHSFAHALESATQYAIPHGTAVGIGMIAALRHPESKNSQKTNLLKEYCTKLLEITKPLIANGYGSFDPSQFINSLDRDKKNSNEFLKLVLVNKSDELELMSLPRNRHQLEICLFVLEEAISEVLA